MAAQIRASAGRAAPGAIAGAAPLFLNEANGGHGAVGAGLVRHPLPAVHFCNNLSRYGLQEQSAEDVERKKLARLRKLRLLAKKALWHYRKCCLAQRNSIWWSLETEKRVQNCLDFFESINKSRAVEELPPIDASGFVAKLAGSVPRNAVFPIAAGCSAETRALGIKVTSSQSGDASGPCRTDDIPLPRFMMHPHSSFRSAWDILTLFLLLYCIFSIPFQMSFSSEIPAIYVAPGNDEDLDTSSAVAEVGALDYLDLTIDAIFMMDVLLNFRTAFLRPHSTRSSILETRARVIAVRYMKTSFLPDVVSSLPYTPYP